MAGIQINLIPAPGRLRKLAGHCTRPRRLTRSLADVGRPESGAYRLTIAPGGITLQAPAQEGLFYAGQTLAQIRRQCGSRLPCLEITDWPAYPVRGFYHDVSRGKVPTLKTLLALAETCASFKLNHLELYIEHTYAFRNHPEVWKNADPLTADEIRTLDARCAELHIDLVPSFSTFGHFYTWIHHKFPELNELERNVSGEPFNWWDRMLHYTLDCRNPRSIQLVREIIREVRPLFRSKYFNICADETFDLGTGRNKALAEKAGKGRLYVDFLNQIMAAVKEAGAIPLFWGDVIGHHPGLLPEIAREAIALDWDYSPDLRNTKAGLMEKSGRNYFVCPGTSGWNMWLPDFQKAHLNITRLARHGRKHGASGLLNTDWGDFGHINTLGTSLPGLALGAAAAWNTGIRGLSPSSFDAAVSRLVLGDASGKLLPLLKKYATARKGSWTALSRMEQPVSVDCQGQKTDPATGLPPDIFQHTARAHLSAWKTMRKLEPRIEKILARIRPQDRLIKHEIRTGLLGLRVMEEVHLLLHARKKKIPGLPFAPHSTALRLRGLERQLTFVWNQRNKPAELSRICEVLHRLRSRISAAAQP